MGAPLEDARHLTQRYERLRQEAEAQVSSQSYSLLLLLKVMALDSGL